MKKTMALLLAVGLTLSLAGCGGQSSGPASSGPASSGQQGVSSSPAGIDASGSQSDKPYAGQSICVQVWGGTYEETMREYAIPMFEEMTGATVEVLTGAAPLSQLAMEGDSATVDVVHLDESELIEGEKMGVFAPIDVSKLTNGKNLYEEALVYDSAVVTNWGTYGLCYRTDLIDKPASWRDMWDDAYAGGKVGFYDYTMGGGLEMIDMVARLSGYEITDTEHWDELFADLEDLKDNIGLFITRNEDVYTMLSNGDIYMATFTNGQAMMLKESNENTAFVMLPEGVPAMTTFATVTAGTQKEELAYIFLDVLCSPEVQKAYAERNYYAPSNSETELSDELKAFMPYGQEEISKLVYMDVAGLAEIRDDLIERIEQDFKG